LHPNEIVDAAIPVEQFLVIGFPVASANGEVVTGVVVRDVGCVPDLSI